MAVGERGDVDKGFLFRGVLNNEPKTTLIVPAFNTALQTHGGSVPEQHIHLGVRAAGLARHGA